MIISNILLVTSENITIFSIKKEILGIFLNVEINHNIEISELIHLDEYRKLPNKYLNKEYYLLQS